MSHTIRLRLTVLYGSLFLASGTGLLTVIYILLKHQYTEGFFISTGQIRGSALSIGVSKSVGGAIVSGSSGGVALPTQLPTPPVGQILASKVQAHQLSVAALHQLLIDSGVALAIMAVLAIWLGWVVAGRALQPLRTITNAARNISASDLHQRLALDGPEDELKQLGNTFDGLLERLEASFNAQRQFVANASHELRTPLTLERALVEVALADPEATEESLRDTLKRVLVAGEQQERLIEALLTLSRSQRGLDQRQPFDLATVTQEILIARSREAEEQRLTIETVLHPALAWGDPRLGERLIANLVDNAIRHNVREGWIRIETGMRAGQAVLSVANSGQVVPSSEVERLFDPFQRFVDGRTGDDPGLGLGLSIVRAIAEAHGAVLTSRAQPEGGLAIEVSFPIPAS